MSLAHQSLIIFWQVLVALSVKGALLYHWLRHTLSRNLTVTLCHNSGHVPISQESAEGAVLERDSCRSVHLHVTLPLWTLMQPPPELHPSLHQNNFKKMQQHHQDIKGQALYSKRDMNTFALRSAVLVRTCLL